MKITKYLFCVFFMTLSLSACKLDLSSKVSIGNLNRVALSQEGGVTGLGTIKLEVGMLDQCQNQGQFFFFGSGESF